MFEIEESIGFLLAKVHQRGYALFKEQLDPYDLTPPQFSLLAFLCKEDGLSQADLSERTQIDRTTMVGLIDRLAKQGFLLRAPDPSDRRAYRVCLTEQGKSLARELFEIAWQASERFTAPLSPEEEETFRNLLKKMRT